jgi:excisionase family DNA binding protein
VTEPRRPRLAAPIAGFGAHWFAILLRAHGPEHLARLQAEVDAGRLHPRYLADAQQAWAAVDQAADDWLTWRASVGGSAEPRLAEAAAPSEVISTREAADMLRVTERRVRQLLAEGRLAGEQRGRVWLVERASVALYATVRDAA